MPTWPQTQRKLARTPACQAFRHPRGRGTLVLHGLEEGRRLESERVPSRVGVGRETGMDCRLAPRDRQ